MSEILSCTARPTKNQFLTQGTRKRGFNGENPVPEKPKVEALESLRIRIKHA